ncbi:lytic transglycosylase [Streptomyces adustus]|uniref:Lytic transglycosylase n=1 Tax=Streptomyces adustus TaxID=1609272 RepID=A0A5N8VTI0_9ACTN|nr:transglycosylase SLT domain-containing protein [Streptomyces adustus]MPY38102.1 lytic transglycosylase [Streptomyces adustus]
MPKHSFIRGQRRKLNSSHKIAIVGVAALGVTTVVVSAGTSSAEPASRAVTSAHVAYSTEQIKDVKASVTDRLAGDSVKIEAIAAQKKADETARQQAEAKRRAAAEPQAAPQRTEARPAEQPASRSAERPQVQKAAPKTYANNLDGWIRESLDIMASKGIPGSYNGLHRNIMRESSGNPMAINGWDTNAAKGIPSKGLLQVIQPTFNAYHVAGTSWNIYDPVANITAACNYAADRYGSMDNVNSAY